MHILILNQLPFSSLGNWLIFLSERAPPLVFGLLAAGPCLSGLVQAQGSVNWEKLLWALIGVLVGVLAVHDSYITIVTAVVNTNCRVFRIGACNCPPDAAVAD